MLLIHLLQGSQEGLILRLQTFCREQIIDKLFDRDEDAPEIQIEIENSASVPLVDEETSSN